MIFHALFSVSMPQDDQTIKIDIMCPTNHAGILYHYLELDEVDWMVFLSHKRLRM